MRYPIDTRVRVVRSRRGNLNKEGVVIDLDENDPHGYVYAVDLRSDDCEPWWYRDGSIEPIISDGNTLSTWGEVLNDTGWQPGKVTASVLDNTEESRDE